VREYSRQDSQLLTPSFAEDPQPSSLYGVVTFMKNFKLFVFKFNKIHCIVIFVRTTKIFITISLLTFIIYMFLFVFVPMPFDVMF